MNLASILDREPPHSYEAESALVGSMLCNPDRAIDAAEIVKASDFRDATLAYLWRVSLSIYEDTGALDLVLLVNRVRRDNQLAAVGGEEFLEQVIATVPSGANAVHYARTIRNHSRTRQAIQTFGDALHEIHSGHVVGDTLIERVYAKVQDLADTSTQSEMVSLGEIAKQAARAAKDPPAKHVRTGFDQIDAMLGSGIAPGEMFVLAARPGMGKTSMAMRMAMKVAEQGTPVLIYTLEMTRVQSAQRFLSLLSGIPIGKMRAGSLPKEELDELYIAADKLDTLPIKIVDGSGLTNQRCKSITRRWSATSGGGGLVIVDHIGLMRGDGDNRVQEVGSITRTLKAVAKDNLCAVMALCQLNRSLESREDKRPRLSDLRDSGDIEQDADSVGFIYREGYYASGDHFADTEPAEFHVAKNRNGPTGTINLTWRGAVCEFTEGFNNDA